MDITVLYNMNFAKKNLKIKIFRGRSCFLEMYVFSEANETRRAKGAEPTGAGLYGELEES